MPSKPTALCVCQACNKEFYIAPNRLRYGEGKYCSRGCGYTAKRVDLNERFWPKVQKSDTCWIWLGSRAGGGYGRINIDGTNKPAHQIAWEMENGPLPEGQEICHICDNPPCVRPSHLFAGTRKENVQDMIRKGRRSPLASGKGDRHGMAKLTTEKVTVIIQRYSVGESPKALAEEFGISRAHLHGIVKGRTWRHIPRP